VARKIELLSALDVTRAKKPGLLADGGGLYLNVSESGARSWRFRFILRGRAREVRLGPLHTVSLAEARNEAVECRKLLRRGIDPIEARSVQRSQEALDAARLITFQKSYDDYIKAHRARWRNAEHAQEWSATLKMYAGPLIGPLPVQEIDTGLILHVLEALWVEKRETATRLRQRIEQVLDWVKAHGHRSGGNSARWQTHLETALSTVPRQNRVDHHSALPFDEISEFMAELREHDGISALALQFTILTAARTSETIGMTWREVHTDESVSRTKAGKEHRVPLSKPTLALLDEMRQITNAPEEFVFPGGLSRRPLSNTAMLHLLKRMGRGDLTVHGFRGSFQDWASERTSYPRVVREAALAHAVDSKVEAAYRPGDLFEMRRRLMEDWGKYCQPSRLATVRSASSRRRT
jgi:integrase